MGREVSYIWQDLSSGRRHLVNNENGDHVQCDRLGAILPVNRLDVSGVADTKTRQLDFKTKGEILQHTLKGAEPSRPGPVSDSLRDERVNTKGRYRIRPVSESDLWMKELRLQRKLFPERFEAEQQDDLKFRRKVEEAHKNFRALEKQLGPRAGGLGGFEAQPPKRITQADLQPFMHMKEEDVLPIAGKMDLFGLYRP